ncbi:unnamed protein product [Clonostachys chloroleuca]|uniref:FAD dependent oxidoreductase domain-containing protein n=1 Tax=Clonostachys chloroleuca TaxID=1926264 RepID=A0AA35Q6T3_9HYPO|nr:unnamed protein product [Clonostachys chloroleuca]
MSSKPVPQSVIIIGAGIFGLSTALAIARRHPSTKVTIVDRLTPPVEDGTSVDTTRCIRADYGDPLYAELAEKAQKKIEQDPELSRFYFKQGMSFVAEGTPGPMLDLYKKNLAAVRARADKGLAGDPVEMKSPEAVFQSIHGRAAQPVSDASLGRRKRWNIGYRNMDDAFIDARECVRIYYERCLAQPSIVFRCGVPVDRLAVSGQQARGVILENGQTLSADLTLVAAGAWSNKLVYLDDLIIPSAIEVAWIKLTDDEAVKWKNMSITTNFDTGFNLFPPYRGEIKCLRRSAGYRNTVVIPHPEDPSKTIRTSLPRTVVTNPTDQIPLDAEKALRDNLREMMPQLADRPFDRTKLCWLSQTPSADFIIAPHPRIAGVHVATGGSAHAWKFLPTIGDLVLDSMEGKLDSKLAAKWAFGTKGTSEGNAPRVRGAAQELAHVVRSRL